MAMRRGVPFHRHTRELSRGTSSGPASRITSSIGGPIPGSTEATRCASQCSLKSNYRSNHGSTIDERSSKAISHYVETCYESNIDKALTLSTLQLTNGPNFIYTVSYLGQWKLIYGYRNPVRVDWQLR